MGGAGWEVTSRGQIDRSILKAKMEGVLLDCLEARKFVSTDISKDLYRFLEDGGAKVEKIISRLSLSSLDVAIVLFEYVWLASESAKKIKSRRALDRYKKETTALKARNAAKAKHEKSGAGKVKNAIRLLWPDWQRKPNKYRSASAFARDMLDKYPDEISNQQTVTRWCREWSAAQSTPDAPQS